MNLRYSISDISNIVNGDLQLGDSLHVEIKSLAIDSRKIIFAAKALFVAIQSPQNDGHLYVMDAYHKGVRNFFVNKQVSLPDDCNVVSVSNTVDSLQLLAQYHNEQHKVDTLAIIGSNGKTICKEWLSKLLINQLAIVKSPKSYNSQIGVCLSVWNIQRHHQLAILEAGISTVDEMSKLQKIIQPNTVILTNLGDAHSAGFGHKEQKLREKLVMARHADRLIYCADQEEVHTYLKDQTQIPILSWSESNRDSDLVVRYSRHHTYTNIHLEYKGHSYEFTVHFIDKSSIENITHCLVFVLYKKYDISNIQEHLDELKNVNMRLSLTDGAGSCQIVNDSYNADISSLKIALDFIEIHKGELFKTVILSEFDEHKESLEHSAKQIFKLLKERKIQIAYLIGKSYKKTLAQEDSNIDIRFYDNINTFIDQLTQIEFKKEIILIKGARKHKLERIVAQLERLQHRTILEINLSALSHNLNYFRQQISSNTLQIAVIKAEAYGSGALRIAHFLQDQQIDYIAVAYADEGVALRNSGIHLPIIVLTPDWTDPSVFYQYNLQPQIYHVEHMRMLKKHTQKILKVHINLDTGMNRLGFGEEDIEELKSQIISCNRVKVESIFSHLRASEDASDDDNTYAQINKFELWSQQIMDILPEKPFRHILNSSGVLRFPEAQYDAVRLGLGLYGLSEGSKEKLEPVHSLYSRIIQIKKVKKNETIGYGRKEKANKDMTIGIIPIGYADGIFRILGMRKFEVYSEKGMLPILGHVSMDMTIVDLTDIDEPSPSMEIEFFGTKHSIENMALAAQTISYEILSRISPRVKRVFVEQ